MLTFLIIWLILGLLAFAYALHLCIDDGGILVSDLLMLIMIFVAGGISFYLCVRAMWSDGVFHNLMRSTIWKRD